MISEDTPGNMHVWWWCYYFSKSNKQVTATIFTFFIYHLDPFQDDMVQNQNIAKIQLKSSYFWRLTNELTQNLITMKAMELYMPHLHWHMN